MTRGPAGRGPRFATRRVNVDLDRIGQALGNLIDNALRHTPGGGCVTVSCRRVGRWVQYAVADTGEGIASEHLPHVFDRFYRVDTARDRHHSGSGIGLAIAKALIEAHGGGISPTTAGPGHGSTFTEPLAERRESARIPSWGSDATARTRGGRAGPAQPSTSAGKMSLRHRPSWALW